MENKLPPAPLLKPLPTPALEMELLTLPDSDWNSSAVQDFTLNFTIEPFSQSRTPITICSSSENQNETSTSSLLRKEIRLNRFRKGNEIEALT